MDGKVTYESLIYLRGGNLISVRMFGGLGNQLFQYFAAKSIQSRLECELIFDTSYFNSHLAHKNSDIRDFEFFNAESTYSRKGSSQLQHFYLRGRNLLCRSSEIASRILEIDAPGKREPRISSHVNENWRLEGYYQDFEYYNEYTRRNPKFSWKLNEFSEDFASSIKQLESERVLGIHIRGGDYQKATQLYRTLNSVYYKEAIQYARSIFEEEKIIVFTDDSDYAREILNAVGKIDYEFAPEFPASETLLLLSKLTGLITSNSTFSTWAGALSSEKSLVVSPSTWFTNAQFNHPTLRRAKLL